MHPQQRAEWLSETGADFSDPMKVSRTPIRAETKHAVTSASKYWSEKGSRKFLTKLAFSAGLGVLAAMLIAGILSLYIPASAEGPMMILGMAPLVALFIAIVTAYVAGMFIFYGRRYPDRGYQNSENR